MILFRSVSLLGVQECRSDATLRSVDNSFDYDARRRDQRPAWANAPDGLRHLAEKRSKIVCFFVKNEVSFKRSLSGVRLSSFRKNIAIFSFGAGAGGSSFLLSFSSCHQEEKSNHKS